MNILFIHQNFPGQFKFLAPRLAELGHNIFAMAINHNKNEKLENINLISYDTNRGTTANIHPWVSDFETKVIRADACFRAALKLKADGFSPEIIISHHGWGESLFLKDIWPQAKLGIYCEFYYQPHGADVGFDPEFPIEDEGEVCRLQLKNLNNLLHFEKADAAISPTYWQASTFPDYFRKKISVIHDGIDTNIVCPDASTTVSVKNEDGSIVNLKKSDEIVTFVNRNLEPYRGYHIFIRSLPDLLRRRPNARVLIVGGDGVSYGAKPKNKQKWKDIFINEIRPKLKDSEWMRIHFLGFIPYQSFISLLQISTVHVYFTYPFILSWSLLEAMSAGCTIVASDTKPLHEAITHNETGRLVPFFDSKLLTEEVCSLLENLKVRHQLGTKARQFVKDNYDLKTVTLPRQVNWVLSLREYQDAH